jgi:hypothetical protein
MKIDEWRNTIKEKKNMIVQASTIEETEGGDGLTEISIGMSYKFWSVYNNGNDEELYKKYQIGEYNKLVMCAITETTDINRRKYNTINRKNIIKTLEKNGIINIKLNEIEYFNELTKNKFIISPEGNGIDCHRHYEAIMAGSIPIVEENEIIKKKYGNVPILYTKDYSEITEEYLIEKYNEIIKKDYDYNRMFITNIEETLREKTKKRGNYWMMRLLKIPYY